MADYRTEEEQIELLKKWWQENGKATVAGVVVALAGYSGWIGWTGHQQATMAQAADAYQQMLAADESPTGKVQSAEIAEQLRKDHPDTVYAIFAALQQVRDAVEANDLTRAAELLAWAQSHHPDATLQPLVSLRLAQVQYAQGDFDKALASLAAVKNTPAWDAAVAELRGDILLAQGKADDARNSYEAALKALDSSGAQERRADVEMKLSDLAKPALPAEAGSST